MLYSAQAGDTKEEDQDEEMERPTQRPYHRRAHPGSAKSLTSNAEARSKSVHNAGNACNKGLRKRIPHDVARRQLASARNQYVGNIATLTGKAVADLTENDLRTTHGHDVMKRGMISLDANTIAQARKAIKRASAEGYGSIYERFTRDRTYALRMIEAGFNQRTMRQWDCLIQAVLPNPCRSHPQRRMAQGSSPDPLSDQIF